MKNFKIYSIALLLVILVGCALLLLSCDTAPVDPCAEGHTLVTDAAVKATCTQKGLTEGTHCSVCQKVLTEQAPAEKLAHTPGEWITVTEATCTQKGSAYRACTVCESITETKTTDTAEHTFSEWETLIAPTCEANGSKTRSCTSCNATERESDRKSVV